MNEIFIRTLSGTIYVAIIYPIAGSWTWSTPSLEGFGGGWLFHKDFHDY